MCMATFPGHSEHDKTIWLGRPMDETKAVTFDMQRSWHPAFACDSEGSKDLDRRIRPDLDSRKMLYKFVHMVLFEAIEIKYESTVLTISPARPRASLTISSGFT